MTERIIRFEPGYDCIRFECVYGSKTCIPHTGGSHGVHGLTIRFVLRGDAGAVQFVIYSGWLPEPQPYGQAHYMAADLGCHSRTPRYDGQGSMGPCELLDGTPCYYDGSGLNAEEPFRILCSFGHEALWAYLEEMYRHTFEGADFPANDAPYPHTPRKAP